MLVIVQDEKEIHTSNPLLMMLADRLCSLKADKNKYSEEEYKELDWLAFEDITNAFKSIVNESGLDYADLVTPCGDWITSTEI